MVVRRQLGVDEMSSATMTFVRGFATLRDGEKTRAVFLLDSEFCVESEFEDVGALIRAGVDLGEFAGTLLDKASPKSYSRSQLAPLILQPGKIICLGLNYAQHIAEMGHEQPDYPTFFAKFADSLTGPFSDIRLPTISNKADYEGEMAVVIGKNARNVDSPDALACIAGFTISNDTTMRDYQWRTSQFLQGKMFEASTPLGPVLVDGKTIDYGRDLSIKTSVNGVERQSSRTSKMIFGVAETISYISKIVTLRPGDILLTGTPAGVGSKMKPPIFLKDGDLVVCQIEGLGEIANRFIS